MNKKDLIEKIQKKEGLKMLFDGLNFNNFKVLEETNENNLTVGFDLVGHYEIYNISLGFNIQVVGDKFLLTNENDIKTPQEGITLYEKDSELFEDFDKMFKFIHSIFNKFFIFEVKRFSDRLLKLQEIKKGLDSGINILIDPNLYTKEELNFIITERLI